MYILIQFSNIKFYWHTKVYIIRFSVESIRLTVFTYVYHFVNKWILIQKINTSSLHVPNCIMCVNLQGEEGKHKIGMEKEKQLLVNLYHGTSLYLYICTEQKYDFWYLSCDTILFYMVFQFWRILSYFYSMWIILSLKQGGVRSTVVVRWTVGQQVERSIMHRGIIHNKMHLISPGCPRLSIALECRIVA